LFYKVIAIQPRENRESTRENQGNRVDGRSLPGRVDAFALGRRLSITLRRDIVIRVR
jgi:hypothetical protein